MKTEILHPQLLLRSTGRRHRGASQGAQTASLFPWQWVWCWDQAVEHFTPWGVVTNDRATRQQRQRQASQGLTSWEEPQREPLDCTQAGAAPLRSGGGALPRGQTLLSRQHLEDMMTDMSKEHRKPCGNA